jgi:hypothetical protein
LLRFAKNLHLRETTHKARKWLSFSSCTTSFLVLMNLRSALAYPNASYNESGTYKPESVDILG